MVVARSGAGMVKSSVVAVAMESMVESSVVAGIMVERKKKQVAKWEEACIYSCLFACKQCKYRISCLAI